MAIKQALLQAVGTIPRILHVEDDADLSIMLSAALRGRAELVTARTLREAKQLLETRAFAAVVLDLGLPDGSGLSLLELIGNSCSAPPVLILSGQDVPLDVAARVQASLVKSCIAEAQIVDTIMDLVSPRPRSQQNKAS